MTITANEAGRDEVREAEYLTPGLIHEIRQPLMGIKAGLQLVAASLGETVTALDDWDMMVRQVSRLEELLHSWQQLFDPGNPSAGEFAVEPVLRRATDLLSFRLRRLGGRFGVAVEAPHAAAYGTPKHLLHAIVNLLANAVDAVEEKGGGRVELRVVAVPLADGQRPEIRVADEGSGIAAENREHVFEARFTTKADRGSGLGLHIARKVMEATGGGIVLVPDGDPLRRPWARTEFAIHFGMPRQRP